MGSGSAEVIAAQTVIIPGSKGNTDKYRDRNTTLIFYTRDDIMA